MTQSTKPYQPVDAPDSNPADIDVACDRLRDMLGCSQESALDLLYGIAVSNGGGLYELAHIVAHTGDPRPYVEALHQNLRD